MSFIGEFSQCLPNVFIQRCRKNFSQTLLYIYIIPLQPFMPCLKAAKKDINYNSDALHLVVGATFALKFNDARSSVY